LSSGTEQGVEEAGYGEYVTQLGKDAQDNEVEFANVGQEKIVQQLVVDYDSKNLDWDAQSLCLSYSASGATSSYAQRQAVMRAASTQTEEIATMPPRPPHLPSSRERGAQKEGREKDFSRARKLRTITRVPSARCVLTFNVFAETPTAMMTQEIVKLAPAMNPCCQPGCCSLHKNLKSMRHHIGSMLQSLSCQNFSSDDQVQCAVCLHLQPQEDDDEFFCDMCCGGLVREMVSGAASSDAKADDEI